MADTVEKEKMEEILSDDIEIGSDIVNDKLETEIPDANYYIKSGDALECGEVYEIASREKTKMLIFIGPAGSGKTTIETSLYQLFQKSSVGGYYFAGSNTIQAYESRSFYTRIRSKEIVPSTQRTSLEMGKFFLHLRLFNRSNNEMDNFLFADLSGELFESHIGRIEETKKDFPFIDRAKYIIGVLDGALLKNKRKKNSTVESMLELVQTLYDAELINSECILQIIFSKYELLSDLENADDLLKNIKNSIKLRLSPLFLNIQFFNIAAMPRDTKIFPVGYGVEDLLKSWKERQSHIKKNVLLEEQLNFSEFDKLNRKILGVLE